MSAEGEAIRSNDYRKDTTVKAPSTRPAAVLGLDVGKSSHWARLVDRDGEVLASAPVRNREAELDALFASAPAGTLVVVDQFRNIGSLAVRRARAAGLGVAHLPGLAASRAAGLFAGEAKTDERDAEVIARTALGVPDSLSGVPGRGEALEAAEQLAAEGIDAEVINMHTIKPIDADLIVKSATKTGHVVTVEEHSVIGGLGSAVADVLCEQCPTPLKKIGVNDTFGESGPGAELLHKYGLDAANIVATTKEFLA